MDVGPRVGVDHDHVEQLPTEALSEDLVGALGAIRAAAGSVSERRRLPPHGPLARDAIDKIRQHRQGALRLSVVEALDELVQLLLGGHTLSMAYTADSDGLRTYPRECPWTDSCDEARVTAGPPRFAGRTEVAGRTPAGARNHHHAAAVASAGDG